MASLVVRIAEQPRELPTGDLALLAHLVQLFSYEIRRAGRDPDALLSSLYALSPPTGARPLSRPVGRITGFGLARFIESSGDGTSLRGVYRGAGVASLDRRVLSALSITNERQLYSTDSEAFPVLEHYLVRWHSGFGDLELGKTGRRWGPGWNGTMLLSDNAPEVFQLDWKIRFSLGFLGHDYTFEQWFGTVDDVGGRRSIGARRFSRPFGRRVGVSLGESIKSASTRDWPAALVLPFNAYEHLVFNDQEKAKTTNYLAYGDIWYAPINSVLLYGDLVIDDITTPSFLGGGYHVPRKIGYQLGLRLPHLDHERTDVVLEWALTDGEEPGSSVHEGGTYQHRNPSLSWQHDEVWIGHPMGPNRRGPFARVRQRIGHHFTVIGEYEDERQWRSIPAVHDRRRALLYGAYDFRPDLSVSVQFERNGGALGSDSIGEIWGAYSF
jgi:hypothetical protein